MGTISEIVTLTTASTYMLLSLASLSTDVSTFTFMPTPQQQQQQHHQEINENVSPLLKLSSTSTSKLTTSMLFSTSDTTSTTETSLDGESDVQDKNNKDKEIDLLDEADEIFAYVDKNSDGVISLEELRDHLMGDMGYAKEYTEYLFASIDTDSDGEITKEEMRFAFYNFEALSMYMTLGMGGSDITNRNAFKKLARKNSSTSPETRDKLLVDDLADLIFDIIDTDSSGEISKEELRTHFDAVTSKLDGKNSTDKQAKEYVSTMFATLDANMDGGICREEVRTAFEKYDFKLLARTFGFRVYRKAEV